MKKEVGIYLFLGLLLLGIFLVAYYLTLGITGLAVFEQNNAATFNEGVYENVIYDENLSAVVLAENQTSGTYTSKVLGASENVVWNDLTFVGSEELDFEVRSCSDANCSNASFASADLTNINATSQYFQYRVLFEATGNETLSLQSVSIGSSDIPEPIVTSVSISEPKGTKSASTGIPLNFNTVGEGLTCWYSVHDDEDGAVIQDNTSISGCNNITFDLGAGEGSYIAKIKRYIVASRNTCIILYHCTIFSIMNTIPTC